jgi:hypothetical protein
LAFIHIRFSKKEAEIREALLEAQRPERCEDIGFAPIGRDESYRVIISEDPILKPGGPNVPFMVPYLLINPAMLNAYNYVQNSPANKVDPLGLYDSPGGDTPPADGWVPPPPTSYPWSGLRIDPRGFSCRALCGFSTSLMCWGLAGGAGFGTGGFGWYVGLPCKLLSRSICGEICPPCLTKK